MARQNVHKSNCKSQNAGYSGDESALCLARTGTATITGTFCVSVYDVGNLVQSVDYVVTVLHS